MATKLEQLKEWAKQNVTMIDLLPNNSNLQVTTRLIDVLEDEVDEKYYLSEEKAKKLTLDFSLTSQDKHGIAVREATKQGYALAERGDSVNVSYPTSKTRRGRVGKQVAQTLQAGEVNQGVVVNNKICRRCNNKLKPSDIDGYEYVCFECDENFYEFETKDELKAIIGSTQKNAYVGNGSTSPSLTSAMGQGGGHIPMPVYSNLRIRKLTPLECWRLQGFTDEQFYKAKDSGVSNSQLYKQSGNAITISVADAIIKKITEG